MPSRHANPHNGRCSTPSHKVIKNGVAVLLPAVASFILWFTFNPPNFFPSWNGPIGGIAYSPYEHHQSPTDTLPQASTVARDTRQLAGITNLIRTYSMQGPMLDLAEQAADMGIQVLAGAWIGVDPEHDRGELSALIGLAQGQENVTRVLVGNEALLRNSVTPDTLRSHIRLVRAATRKPVSTAEPWHIWLDHPMLAAATDFLAVHILPYWEGVPVNQAIPYIDHRLQQLREAYPDKPIVLTEVGWPSAGRRIGGAKPSRTNQAYFVRNFLSYAEENNIDYVLLEAYDQPWKTAIEGRVGAHWGIFDSRRNPKWELIGPVRERTNWAYWALFALVIGGTIQTIYLQYFPKISIQQALLIGICFQGCVAAMLCPSMMLTDYYLSPLGLTIWLILIISQWILYALFISDLVQVANVAWRKPQRRFHNTSSSPLAHAPFVSIHVPCSDEPPEIVVRTLTSLSGLEYPNFEVIVISNNCRYPSRWRPIESACAHLGSRFRFIHRDHCPGFKAGALNLAHEFADNRAEIIAVVDSDYVVEPDWLRTLVPLFEDESIALVQAPQDHLSPHLNNFKRKCFWEYAGFFQIGMVQRNEADAIIQHGTMTLIRKMALERVGGWGEWCITEDAELGLRLLESGWHSAYVPHSFGRGQLPNDFGAYKSQRFRWVYGAMQILKHHGLALLGLRPCQLSPAQRYHFIAGWLPWLADAGGLLFTISALVWTVVMTTMSAQFPTPPAIFLVPVLFIFLAKQACSYALYSMRLNCTKADRCRAALAGLALSHTVARAVLSGLITSGTPFRRTPKDVSNIGLREAFKMVATESALLLLIVVVSVGYFLRCDITEPANGLWLLILTIQAIPYMAALWMTANNATENWTTARDHIDEGFVEKDVHTYKKSTTASTSSPKKASA
ncbi:MAG: Cellulose synthase catalytic subunit [UDP-forming] [Alphaproteobacteria bacterium MarineAlpha9_Bin7]|nr:MAG: Cellulose synthase catalytic subunit [UDP-forming] [Alphaproteobacteria bacterium MarineAlpha9_Bin7]